MKPPLFALNALFSSCIRIVQFLFLYFFYACLTNATRETIIQGNSIQYYSFSNGYAFYSIPFPDHLLHDPYILIQSYIYTLYVFPYTVLLYGWKFLK